MAIQGRTIRPLIPFNMLFSIDIGIIRFLQEFCIDDELFDLKTLKKMSNREILLLMQSRGNSNPLSILNVHGDRDKIYKELMEDYEEQIIEKSPLTDFGQMIYTECTMQPGNGIDTSLLVKNHLQLKKLNKSFLISERLRIIICVYISDHIDTNLSIDAYYVNSYEELYNPHISDRFYENTTEKNIYLSDTVYNQEFLKKHEFGKLSGDNEFTTIKLWREV